MTEEWLDHVELPDGQSADLLKRYPYERALMIAEARERDMALTQVRLEEGGTKGRVQRMTATGFADVVLRASLWRANLKHELTGQPLIAEQVGMANAKIVETLSDRAMENYVAWIDEAYGGPKDSSGTDSPTPTSEIPEPSDLTTPEAPPSETGESPTSSAPSRATP